MMRFLLIGLSLIFMACTRKVGHSSRQAQPSELDSLLFASDLMEGDTATTPKPLRAKAYNGSKPLYWRLVHTELELKLDWAQEEVLGEAHLWLTPHFASRDSLAIDAKAFSFDTFYIQSPRDVKITSSQYDYKKLYLRFSRALSPRETLEVVIRYRAHPAWVDSLFTTESDQAISSRKGAYFINAKGERPCVPRQFWTQGEPESASAWFPTLDSPNQKTTQKLCVTVEDSLVTLSNGLLVTQARLPNGYRRDCWELRQPHAPYLFALIVGPFVVTRDQWRGKDVSYYVEPNWAPHTKTIFGNTPKMLEFFSNLLGIPYPWPKYGQVIVREFVSGAMENTTAVVHGDMLFFDKSVALTDDEKETVIAHELFHHWFGDLVTCESWAQLPLNESFANYAEYLWLEYSRGIESAEDHRRQDLQTYLFEAMSEKVPLIRFFHQDPMEMFDAHSYQKGGLVLHLLRRMVGDSAFFASLREYLITNAYGATDIDHLRHAFEKVTGLDWTWFFWQHFERSDEVSLRIKGEAKGDTLEMLIFQQGYDSASGPYRYFLPLLVASREKGVEFIPFELVGDTVIRLVRKGLRYADYDPEHLFVGSVQRAYPTSWWEGLLEAPAYPARVLALGELSTQVGDSATLERILRTYPASSVAWKVRVWDALGYLSEPPSQVWKLAMEGVTDTSAKVRAAVWEWAYNYFSQVGDSLSKEAPIVLAWQAAAQKALGDSSAAVLQDVLGVLYLLDPEAARQAATRFLSHPSEEIFLTAVSILLRAKDSVGVVALLQRQPCLTGLSARATSVGLLALALRDFPSYQDQTLASLQIIARRAEPWYLRLFAVRSLRRLSGLDQRIRPFLRELKATERHPMLRKLYQQEL